jgi:hypothetical protein
MRIKNIFFFIAITAMLPSCKKWLDAKPDKKLVIPSKVEDLQALLDQNEIMNFSSPSLGEMSTTDYWLTDTDLASLSPQENAVYIWGGDIYYQGFPNDWSNAYNPVYFSNIVLEKIDGFQKTDQNKTAWDNVKGSALLFRGKSFLDAAWIWCKTYHTASELSDYGLPLRLSSDFNEKSVRSNLKETYARIIADLKASAPYLPAIPFHVMRPSKAAAYGYLARTYLSMRAYDSCLKYTQLAMAENHELLDYNSQSAATTYPFGRFSKEVIMHSSIQPAYYNLENSIARVDSQLYNSYDDKDLRKSLYYMPFGDGTYFYRGSYARRLPFNGVAVNELYLMSAECRARAGDKQGALKDLNDLLINRYETGSFIPYTAVDAAAALNLVLQERRKELIFHGLRWMDIKRLNKEGANITLQRKVNGQSILLTPNANRYAQPIPPDIIAITGMEQNPF